MLADASWYDYDDKEDDQQEMKFNDNQALADFLNSQAQMQLR